MASCIVMMATTLATAKMAELTPSQRAVAITMAQTVALWALGMPPSPHMRSSWNLPSRIKLMRVFSTCATNQPRSDTVRIGLNEKIS